MLATRHRYLCMATTNVAHESLGTLGSIAKFNAKYNKVIADDIDVNILGRICSNKRLCYCRESAMHIGGGAGGPWGAQAPPQ